MRSVMSQQADFCMASR